MVTGPMPRNPNATRPKANTGAAFISSGGKPRADRVADGHQRHHRQSQPERAEVAGHQS